MGSARMGEIVKIEAEPELKGIPVRVLVVEDDPTLQKGLDHCLRDLGHQTVLASDGHYADTLLATEPFDLAVLDLGLPRMDGLTVLERLRRRGGRLPVLILSARDRTEDRVRGLDSGADDYLTKPFELSEFEARVRALLRRAQGAAVSLGRLQWRQDHRTATVAGQVLELSRHELAVLEALMQTPGSIVAKDQLAHGLGEQGEAATDNTVEVYIHRLRRKLEGAQARIRTVRGLGYRIEEDADAQ